MQQPRAFRLGLLGHPVSHSKSPEIFGAFFGEEGLKEAGYQLFDLSSMEDFQAFLEDQLKQDIPLIGFNVTVPHKVGIMGYLDSVSAGARAVGAVNTVLVERSNTGIVLRGFNTDVDGFSESLTHIRNQSNTEFSNAILLGNGGSAKAVKFVLEQQQIPYVVWHRNQILGEHPVQSTLSDCIQPNTLFIHTTPVGMWPNTQDCIALPWNEIRSTHRLIDLVYNPETTILMQRFQEIGATAMNGKSMLEHQAIAAWNLFKRNIY